MRENDLTVPAPGQTLPGAFEVRVRVRGEHTHDGIAVIEETVPPGMLVPPHTHANDVWVKVEEGEIGVLVGEEIRTAVEGDWGTQAAGGATRHVEPDATTGSGDRGADPRWVRALL